MENAEKEYIEEKQKQGNSSEENVEWWYQKWSFPIISIVSTISISEWNAIHNQLVEWLDTIDANRIQIFPAHHENIRNRML
jgi:hypothetical protein